MQLLSEIIIAVENLAKLKYQLTTIKYVIHRHLPSDLGTLRKLGKL